MPESGVLAMWPLTSKVLDTKLSALPVGDLQTAQLLPQSVDWARGWFSWHVSGCHPPETLVSLPHQSPPPLTML